MCVCVCVCAENKLESRGSESRNGQQRRWDKEVYCRPWTLGRDMRSRDLDCVCDGYESAVRRNQMAMGARRCGCNIATARKLMRSALSTASGKVCN